MASRTRKQAPVTLTGSFVIDRETPNKFRFSEVVDEGGTAVSDTIYVSKAALDAAGVTNPTAISVTIAVVASEATPAPALSVVSDDTSGK